MTNEHPPVDAPPARTPLTEVPPAADVAQPPSEVPPAEAPPAADAAQPPDVPPAPDVTATEPPPRPRRRDPVLGTVGQIAGVRGSSSACCSSSV